MTVQLTSEIGSNFCYAPWTNIHVTTEGMYKTCCAGNEVVGHVKTIPIKDILANTKISEIKHALLNNKTHINCEGCLQLEKHTSESERNWYFSIAKNKTINLNNIEDYHLQNIDLRWSNTCNLSCVYCDHQFSSQWASLKKQPIERLDYKNTLDGILKFIDSNKASLQQISLLGGEPLLQKENESLLDIIPDNILIYVITNLSVELENNKIFKKLIKKSNVVWDISFETVETKFEYVRRGSQWNLMLKNIKYLQENTLDRPGHGIGITSQYCVYNALELSNLYQYFLDYDLPIMRWSELTNPDILSVRKLPQRFINKAIEELTLSSKLHPYTPFLQEMANSLRQLNNSRTDCQELYNWHIKMEQNYWPNSNLKFANLWVDFRET